jgi:hypothetical protein
MVTFPEWAEVTVYRITQGVRAGYTATVYWLETYGTIGGSDLPNAMWEHRARGQIDKCAEAAALRMAFPEELSEPTAEEMEGQRIFNPDVARDITPKSDGIEAPPPPTAALAPPRDKAVNNIAPVINAEPKEPARKPDNGEAPPPPKSLKKQARASAEEPAKEATISPGQKRLIEDLKASAEALDAREEKPFDQGVYLAELEKKLSVDDADLDELAARHDAIADQLNKAGKIAAAGLFKAYAR